MIYNKIEALRKERKIPKMDFYKQIGMAASGYNEMVRNNSMKLSTLIKIAEVLGVDVDYFFSITVDADTLEKAKKIIASASLELNDSGVDVPGKKTKVQFEVEYLASRVTQLKQEIAAKDKIIEEQKKLIDKMDTNIIIK